METKAAIAARGVLFLCTGNSARSILAEAILARLGGDRFRAFSAGSHPVGRVNRFAIELLRDLGHPVAGLRSKGWEAFAQPGGPTLEIVITVCDRAAAEACPAWPGRPIAGHWSIADPAEGDDDAKRAAFRRAYRDLERRIEALAALPIDDLDGPALRQALDAIGRAPPDDA